jgi:uncharacterized surface protein with fasciclin (FAS1) repeats
MPTGAILVREIHKVKPLKIISAILAATIILVGSTSSQASLPIPKQAGVATALDTLSVGAALAQAGYTSAPMRQEDGYPLVQAKIGTTPIALLLDSGSPFDLLLDSALAAGEQSDVHMTNVLSGYWTYTISHGHWAAVDRLSLGSSTLDGLEAKVEPLSPSMPLALMGATALISRGAIIDYATNTLYLLTPHDPSAPIQQTAGVRPATLRAALEQAGQYRTFLALMQHAGLMQLLDSAASHDVASDSIAWLGLRINATQLSGVGMMPPNDMHLRLTRQAMDQQLRGSNRRTAFVPTDAAFARLPAETLNALRADTARLARLLRAHLYSGAAIDTSAMRTFIRGVAQPGHDGSAFGFHTLGARIDIDRLSSWEEGRVISRATIVQPDLRVAHGVAIAHGIDHVLGLSSPPPFVATLIRQGYTGIPLHRREDGNAYQVQATVNGVPMRLTIATGARTELALDQQSAAHLPPPQGGEYVLAFDSVKVGPVHVETADFSTSIQAAQAQGYNTEAGTIGSAFLAKYHAIMDCAAGMLYLRVPSISQVHPAPTPMSH